MRLKSIKLAGFKSFVDPTTVPFTTNMTAVVGPNGCGKSNIIDAVRWVMGESSAKNLRGESMTDVIFNGAAGRQPVGQASIELLFDNQSGKLAGEYAAFTEISIKRKVTREGTSQYYLNGSKCRRRDVTDIFLGTGMGPRSYAIIEQGMIARLIESKPEELRVYLEEAAGISKYKERRRETENRMRRTQENLDRLADIREELNKQLQHLKRQANAAEKYAEYKKEERFLSAKLHYIYWRLLDSDLEGKSKLEAQYEQEIESAVLAKNSNENKIDAFKTLVEERQEEFNKSQAKYYQSGAEIATIEQKLKYEKSRQAEQSALLERLQEEVTKLNEVIALDKESLETASMELETIEAQLIELEELSLQSAEQLEIQEQRMLDWQTEWDEFNRNNSDAQKSAELEQAKIQQLENQLKSFELRHEKLTKEELELNEQLEGLDVGQWEQEILMLDERGLEEQEKLDEVLPQIDKYENKLETSLDQRTQALDDLSSKKAVLASLKTLQDSMLNEDSDLELTGALQSLADSGRLIEQINVEKEWELAVQHVLSDWLQSYVTSNLHGAYDLESITESNQTFSAVEAEGMFSSESAPGSLAAVVKGASSLNFLLNTVKLAENESEAKAMLQTLKDDESVVLKSGLWLSKNWMRLYCPDSVNEGAIDRANKIKDIESELPDIQARVDSADADIETYKLKLNELRTQLNSFEQSLKNLTNEKSKLAAAYGADQARYDQFQLRKRRNSEELSEIIESIEQSRELLAESRHIWQESLVSVEDMSFKREALLEKKESVVDSLDNARQASRDRQNQVHQKQLEQAQRQNHKQSISQTITRLESELQAKQIQIQQVSSRDGEDSSEIEELSGQLEGLLETRLMAEESLTASKVSLEEALGTLRDEEGARVKHEANIQAVREKLSTIRMDSQALAINKKNLEERIEEDGFEAAQLTEQITEEDNEENLKKTLEQLSAKIQRLGSINLAAIDEYKIQSERKQELDAQNDELVEALDTLVEAIKKIDRETRARFKETFDQVNEGLQRLFPKIFGGGNAYLELTDDNLLETGVMIIARPPGKKNATIHLLSGGEKSLTAIALIFAIFELNPAPFCMLDEVDAPLDDANVGRFANMVKEMSSQVQFIYISHNKVSMEKADQLMGVTMHEPGVSRLVSVDIDEAAALVEA